ncbi:MAG: glycosyltransferase [Clostridiales bacterium]|nr:glycosyltransferase [Clostridiales bacterium]
MEAKEYIYSVLMSVYKNDKPDYLIQAVDSMLQQTVLPEQFVLVVDGHVSEEINTVISKYERNESMFTVVRLKENGGLANALNVGLEYCRNELVARMDADDISLPTRCERELEMFARYQDLAVCGCNIDEFYGTPDNVRTSRIVPETYEEIKKFMRKRQPFNHPTVMYRKSKVTEAGGYINLKRKEDFDLFSQMLSNGCYAVNIGESLYLYRANEDNYARRKSWQNFKSAIYVYARHLKRKGCTVIDFIIISLAELSFLILPVGAVKVLSDRLLRRAVHNEG